MRARLFSKRWIAILPAIVAVLLLNSVLSYRNTEQLDRDAWWVAHTHEVIAQLGDVLESLVDSETAFRGYAATGEPVFLQPLGAATRRLPSQLAHLRDLTRDNPAQQRRSATLETLAAEDLRDVARDITYATNRDVDRERVMDATGAGKRRMDAIRSLVGEMTAAERELLARRQAQTQGTYAWATASNVVFTMLGLFMTLAFAWLLARSLRNDRVASARIHEQRQLLQATLSSIGDAVIATDAQGAVTFLNPVAQELTGWTSTKAAGMPLKEVFTIVNEDTRQPVDNPALRALREGRIVGLANHTVLIARDGRETPIDDSAGPIRTDDGGVSGAVLVFRDITARHQAASRLRESEARMRLLLASMPQKIATTLPNGEVDYFNPAWTDYTGKPIDDLLGWGWRQVIHPDEAEENIRVWKTAIASGEPFHFEQRLLRADGEYRWHVSRAVALKDNAGQVVMWVGTNTDIHEERLATDELRRLAEELSQADTRKNEFLATLAHELRNPLAPIRSGLNLMRLSRGTGEHFETALSLMERQLSHMIRLVDDLMDVSRINHGRIELQRQPVSLGDVLNSAVESSRILIDSMGHAMSVALPEVPPIVDADLTRLAQVFANLLNNAAKYTDAGGRIDVSVERDGAEAVVTIRDNGVGIPPEKLETIFEMFRQVDHSLEKSQGGLGIGLTLVQRLVEMHDGSIVAHSTGLGHGSTFTVRLPVSESAPVLPAAARSTDATARAEALRILIIDDNRDSADVLATLLQLMGHATRTAYDGIEGFAAADAFRPDAILLDIGLPGINGYDTCRRIRELPWAAKVLIVAVTGWGQEADRRRSSEAGFDRHIVKPIDPESLGDLLAGSR